MNNFMPEANAGLYQAILSPENIYSAIYALESYIEEECLLSPEDIYMYRRLGDKYDFAYIDSIIEACQTRLHSILDDPEEFFEIQLYFKMRGYTADNTLAARPVHSAALIDQICMVCLLNSLLFELSPRKELQRSDIANLIPAHFYATVPSTKADQLFKPCQDQFQLYANTIIAKNERYKQTQEYSYGVSLELSDFLASIDPLFIYHYILAYLDDGQGDNEDLYYLKRVLLKLLFFKIKSEAFDLGAKERYYSVISAKEQQVKKLNINQGLAEGLPHVAFFAELCMLELSRLFEKYFPGDSCYYGAEAVLYTNVAELVHNFDDLVGLLKLDLDEFFESYKTVELVLPSEIQKQYEQQQFKLTLAHDSGFCDLSQEDSLSILAQLPRIVQRDAQKLDVSNETELENRLQRVDAILQTLGEFRPQAIMESQLDFTHVDPALQPEAYSTEPEPMVLGEPTESYEESLEEDYDKKLDEELFGGMDEDINAIINDKEV